jgi:zinc protease
MTIALSPADKAKAEIPSVSKLAFHGKLDNGLEVVVVPDRRAPVVTHMVWYRVGGADEPQGKSGIAHFLEHLMFKGTDKIPAGQFSKIVAALGGQDNAFTAQDITAYFQRVEKGKLPDVMRMESDRMANLKLDEKDVLTERKVILEERRSRVDNDPGSLLQEQMMAAMYVAHPYHTPVIGWAPEIAALNRADALAFYKKYYAPNNAILVVTGDVEPDQVMALAKETYGKIPANPAAVARRPRRTGNSRTLLSRAEPYDGKGPGRRSPSTLGPHRWDEQYEPPLQRLGSGSKNRCQHQRLVWRPCPRYGPLRRLCGCRGRCQARRHRGVPRQGARRRCEKRRDR